MGFLRIRECLKWPELSEVSSMSLPSLPFGISSFGNIRLSDRVYVDKTAQIFPWLINILECCWQDHDDSVNLFLRPCSTRSSAAVTKIFKAWRSKSSGKNESRIRLSGWTFLWLALAGSSVLSWILFCTSWTPSASMAFNAIVICCLICWKSCRNG